MRISIDECEVGRAERVLLTLRIFQLSNAAATSLLKGGILRGIRIRKTFVVRIRKPASGSLGLGSSEAA